MTGVIVMVGCAAVAAVSLMIGIRIGRAAANYQWIQTVVDHGINRAMAAHGYEMQPDEEEQDTTIDAVSSPQLTLPTFDNDDTAA